MEWQGKAKGESPNMLGRGVTMRTEAKTNALVSMIKELYEGATKVELEQASGLHHNTIYRWLKAMRVQKIVYVEGWERDTRGCNMIPVYKLGDERDAKRPPRIPSLERTRAYRRRKKLKQIQAALTGGTV